jgi:hypothetical protein
MSDSAVKIGPNGPSLNTSSLRSQGKALLNSMSTPAASAATPASTPASTPAPAQPVTPSVSPLATQSTVSIRPAGEQPVSTPDAGAPAAAAAVPAQPAAPNYVDLPDDALVRVMVNGQEEIKPWGEAKQQHILHRTFTQNQQKLKAEQAAFLAERQQLQQKAAEADKLARLISDPELFVQYAQASPAHAAYLAKMAGSTVAQLTAGAGPQAQAAAVAATSPQAPQNGSELVDFNDLQTVLGQRASELEGRVGQTFEQRLEARAQQILGQVNAVVDQKLTMLQNAHEISQFNQAITKTIDEQLTSNPALRAIPRISDLIRFEVAQLMPESPEQMTEAIGLVTKSIVEGLDQTYNQSRSAQLIAKERLVSEGIEAPAGAPVNNIVKQQPSVVLPGGKMDWNAVRARAKAVLGN